MISCRGKYSPLVEYWSAHRILAAKREALNVLKAEASRAIAAEAERGGGAGRRSGDPGHGGGGGTPKRLDPKVVAHLRDNKFAGKDGGTGWANFYEDLMVAVGAVDKDLELAIKEITT